MTLAPEAAALILRPHLDMCPAWARLCRTMTTGSVSSQLMVAAFAEAVGAGRAAISGFVISDDPLGVYRRRDLRRTIYC